MVWAKQRTGFTIVELLIVIVVIGTLATITVIAYSGIQNRAKTVRSLSTVEEVRNKTAIWNTFLSTYPDLAQLRTNSLSPTNIDTAGGATGPIEARLTSPDITIGASMNAVRANNGDSVFYAPCWDGTKLSGGTVTYWDFAADDTVDVIVGTCP